MENYGKQIIGKNKGKSKGIKVNYFTVLIFLSLKLIPKEVMDDCKEQAKDLWKGGKAKKWYYAIPIILIHLLVIFLIIENIFFRK